MNSIKNYFNPCCKNEPQDFFSKSQRYLGRVSDRVDNVWNLSAEKIDLLAHKYGKFRSGLILGALVVKPLTSAIVFLADSINLLPKFKYPCFSNDSSKLTGFCVLSTVPAIMAILEEVLFRGFCQKFVFDTIPRSIIRKISPKREHILDTKIAKIIRVTTVSMMFSAYHLQNLYVYKKEAVYRELFFTFFVGIGAGIVKESKAGLSGAMGVHFIFNILGVGSLFYGCSAEKT